MSTGYQEAIQLIRAGRLEPAVELLRRQRAASPDDPRLELLLADAYGKLGQGGPALAHARRAAELDPANPQAQIVCAVHLLRGGQGEAALAAFRRVTELQPGNPEAWANLGLAQLQLRRSRAAVESFQRALDLAPGEAVLQAQLGKALQVAGDYAAAAEALRAACRLNPRTLDFRIALADALRAGGGLAEAGAVLEQAVADFGASARLEELRGYLQVVRGRFAEAAAHYQAALALDPRHTDALLGLSRLEGEVEQKPLRQRIEGLLAEDGLDEERRILLLFALGNLLDRAGAHEAAMAAFAEGNRRNRPRAGFDLGRETARFEGIKRAFPGAAPATTAETDSLTPIFVLGMPRSGTTLVEQILAAHPEVTAGGELPYLPRLVQDWPDGPGAGQAYPAGAADLEPAALDALGRRYLEKVARLAGGRPQITDKTPSNFEHLGLIARILPRAKVVHCRRDAIATCCSNFVTLYGGGAGAFSYAFEDLAGYHRLYEDLMAHWQANLQLPILSLSYEALVAEPEAEARRLLAFCGLDWRPEVLDVQARQGQVQTASAIQVRQPIHRDAVKKWRRYGAALEPLKAALGISEA